MDNESTLYRLSPEIAAILFDLAQKKRLSEAMVLEMLVRQAAFNAGIIDAHHPETAFGRLVNMIEDWDMPAQEDYTRDVFERIRSTPEAKRLYDQAIIPLPGQRAEKRKQSVNQRLGRFCKRRTGWESGDEVQLGKDSIGLIQSYTRLKPRATVI